MTSSKPPVRLAAYWPLISLVLVSALAANALTYGIDGNTRERMHYFMGFFLCCFAMLKLFNPRGFAKGFAMYDLLAMRIPSYGYIYPLLELSLGLSYLAFFAPALTCWATVVLTAFGAMGVAGALARGLDINCPCMGSVLAVPLSTVTLIEDIVMGLMAAAMLAMMPIMPM